MKKLILIICLFLVTGCINNNEVEEERGEEVIEETRVSLLAVGDNLIHETIYLEALQEDGTYDFTHLYKGIEAELQSYDLKFINQETIIGGNSLGIGGYPNFNTPTEMIQNLHDVGFNLLNIATNHTLDRGQQGIINMVEELKKVPSLVHDGAYTSEEEYNKITTFEKEGITFSLLSYTYGTNGIVAPYSYSTSYFDEEQIKSDVERAKQISDVVLVSAHWGDENVFSPNSFQTYYAQLFADLEVDLVIGTHPHVIQPLEYVQGINGNETLVAYSLGNFTGGMLTSNNAISGMLSLDFVKNEDIITIENIEWIPLVIHFEGNQNNILPERYNYMTYKVSNYTEELANKHVLHGYNGNIVTLDYINDITKQVIDSQFLK